MWISESLSKTSIAKPTAVRGNVVGSKTGKTEVVSSAEYKGLKCVTPYGVISIPPVSEEAVVLPLVDNEVCIGVVTEVASVQPGEILLKSKGGAEIYLKNDGSVYINGAKVGE